MDYTTLAVSLGANGALLFSAQQWVQHRFRILDEKTSRDTTYREKAHEQLIDSYTSIWKALSELEHYLHYGLAELLEAPGPKNSVDLGKPVRETWASIRSNLLFFPDDLSSDIEKLMLQAGENYNALMKVLKEQVSRSPSASAEYLASIRAANDAMNKLHSSFRDGVSNLRDRYRKTSQLILLGNLPK